MYYSWWCFLKTSCGLLAAIHISHFQLAQVTRKRYWWGKGSSGFQSWIDPPSLEVEIPQLSNRPDPFFLGLRPTRDPTNIQDIQGTIEVMLMLHRFSPWMTWHGILAPWQILFCYRFDNGFCPVETHDLTSKRLDVIIDLHHLPLRHQTRNTHWVI